MRFRKWHIIPLLITIILAFTNPSLKSFQRHVNPENKSLIYTERKNNFILFSTFRMNNGIYEMKYIGIFNCFILVMY